MSRPTSCKNVPAIAPGHLRDHADAERIDRVWERLQRSLPDGAFGRGREPRSNRWALLSAAAVVGFVLGFGVDRWLAAEPSTPADAVADVAPAPETSPLQVFAAGETAREYRLPGGGYLRLAPGTIVDTVTSDARGLTLRLVRGEADMSTQAVGAAARTTPLALLVGQAEVRTAAGNLRVKRSGDTASLEVLRGSARVASPDHELGTRQTTLGPNDRLTVPIRITTAQVVSPSEAHASGVQPPSEEEAAEEETAESTVEPPPGWRKLCTEGKFPEARQLLRAETGGGAAAVAAATNAQDLMCVGDAFFSRGGDAGVAVMALERIVNEFPHSGYLSSALFRLGKIYERAGDLDKARSYWARVHDDVLADDALCRLIQAAARRGNHEALVRLAQQYRTQYPDGACIDEEIERLLAEIAAKQSGSSDSESGQGDADEGESSPSDDEGSKEPAASGSASRPERPDRPADSPPAKDAPGGD